MVLKKWDTIINSKMGAYHPEKSNMNTLDFPKDLSPLTNYALDIFANIISDKNVIINFPDFKFNSVSLFSYIFAEKFNKGVYFLAEEKGASLNSRNKFSHNKNHYLLCDYNNYIYYRLPVFYLKKLRDDDKDFQNNPIDYKLSLEKYLPRADGKFKRKYTEKRVLCDTYSPKMIIDKDNNLFTIKEKLKVILEGNDEYINPEDYPIGLIIIENADRFFSSYGRVESFISWFKDLDSDVKLLIHFNNPSIDYVKLLIKELNFAVIPFNKYILKNNAHLKSISKEYFNNIESYNLDMVNRYNLDSGIVNEEIDILIHEPLVPSGSIDKFFGSAYSSFKKIDMDKVYNQSSLHKALNLLFNLYNLTTNPSYLTIYYSLTKTSLSIPHFIQNFKSRLSMENTKNRFLIYDFIDSLNNMYYELANCKRVNEDLSYARKAKDYILYDLLNDLSKKGEEVFVGTYIDTEPRILNEILEKGGESNLDLIVPINMGMLIQKSDSEKVGKVLVLPGVIPEMYISELFKPYKQIIFLSYDGTNYKFLKEQLDTIYGNILEEKEYMDFFKEILEPFEDIENNPIFKDFYKRFELIEFKEDDETESIVESEFIELEEDFNENSLFNININFNEYMDDWTKSKSNLNADISSEISQKHYDTISFKLQNISTEEFVEKKLPINKSYLTFDNIYHIDDAKELKPSELHSGDYIIIIDNDEKKSLLNLVIDVSDIKSQIDTNLIEYWKLEFLNYVESNNLKYSQVYEIYCDKGGTKTYQAVMQWCKGELMGPNSPEDLYIIGKIINNQVIMDNYESIFKQIALVRVSHRIIGRKLKKMIKSILTDEYLDISSLSDSEYLIYENIQKGIYKIV